MSSLMFGCFDPIRMSIPEALGLGMIVVIFVAVVTTLVWLIDR